MNVGDKAKDFTLLNSDGKEITLSEETKEGKVLLLFFPLAFSGVCTEELCTTRDNMKLYKSLNTNVIGISVDSFFTLNQFKKSNNLKFSLLSDFNKEVSGAYNSLYNEFFGMKGVSKRSAFVVNKEMIIEYAEILEDSSKLPDFKTIRTVLSSI
ncbi:MAG: peroxiredoxin [Balneolaceae bacterium]|nr:MAG: peroxiredoxin [Balneolaceae bacterium]